MKAGKLLRYGIYFLFFACVLLFVGIWHFAYTINSSNNKLDKVEGKISSEGDLKIILYIKTGCSYCAKAEKLLKDNNMAYEVVELKFNPDLQKKLFDQTGQKTVPYIFINDRLIGGYQDLLELKNQNKL